ncbi:FAD-dependent oxidoreductase [Streptomyces sp. TRM S81-3]|uniref:FAD-dependent oxidoreductase n=1 Tax=Streptomyces griseicoloratus TaxID=2752516 RepID=A0A926L7E0_9ACTN|nr:FAD-dependent oxidoreductase [Streptomyces griseicoloratus]MBD0423943.1 FAD-dependent oxidoreductase [Streptomyces griseicoloratus]
MRPYAAADIGTWDLTADVVVAGYGVAGAAAAVEAAHAGAEVLVLERAGGWGGAAALAGGFVYLGGGTALQRACGFDDSPEAMATFLMAAMGPGADAAKISAYCEGSVAHFDWLVGCGVPFKPVFYGEPAWEPAGDEGLMYSGGENAHPFDEIAEPAPRGHLPQMDDKRTGERGGGYMLMKPLVKTAERLGVKAHYGVRIERLVVERDGRVCGVVARSHGERVTVRARRGVVLATGGFTYNEEMLAAHAPLLMGRPGSAVEEHDGIAVKLAQALGAGVAHMDACEVAIHMDPQYLIRGIVVNGRGQRFINEDTYPGRIGQAALFQQGNRTFLVLDEEGFEEARRVSAAPDVLQLPPTWVCESATELAAEMGLPPGALEATLEVYNRHAEDGRDPLLGKAARWLRPLRGPLGAVDLEGMTSGFALGGLTTGTDSEVLHVNGEPIPGLYAAGRATAGIAAWGYASGASLGDGSFFGRRAGRSAALNR